MRAALDSGPNQQGVTLIELIIVLVVGAILVALAAPSFRDIAVNNRMATQTNQLVGQLQLARSEAAKRSRNVLVRAAAGGWTGGWEVVEDTDNSASFTVGDTVLRRTGAIGGNVAITAVGAAGNELMFQRTGALASAVPVTFTVCLPGRSGDYGRQVVVAPTGRPNLNTGITCP